MSISEKDIKLLWGRAASRCSFPDCRVKLAHDTSSQSFVLGEQAHIVAEEPDGPRGKSSLSVKERNSYPNLILLCPTHHTTIDKNIQHYPAEKLYILKIQHELWVEETLSQTNDSKKIAQDLIYSTLVDAAVEDCHFEEWENWTSYALEQPPIWDVDAPIRLFKFRQKILRAVWPGTLPELERALNLLSIVMLEAVETFKRHAKRNRDTDRLEGIRFYRLDRWDKELEAKLSKQYDEWIERCSLNLTPLSRPRILKNKVDD